MKKKNYILLLLVIIIVLAVVGLQKGAPPEKDEKDVSFVGLYCTDNCLFMNTTLANASDCIEECQREKTGLLGEIYQNGVSYCDSLEYEPNTSLDGRSECISLYAMSEGDTTACKTLSKSDMYVCITRVASKDNDISLCEDIPDDFGRDDCIQAVTVLTGDTALCEERFPDTEFRNTCISDIALLKRDESLCAALDEYHKGYCILNVAVYKKDATLCGKLAGETLYEVPLEYRCIENVAQAKGDVSLCDRIPSGEYRESCINGIAD